MKNNLPKTDIIKLLILSLILKKNECDIESIAAAFCHDNDENNVEPSTIKSEFHSSSDNIPNSIRTRYFNS